jgi:hypothetical protein
VIPAGGTLYVTPSFNAFRTRATGPSGGQGLFVQGNYNGHVSNFGEVIDLLAGDGNLVSTVTTPSIPSDNQQYLRITEIMYHPSDPTPAQLLAGYDDGDLFEFIELYNTSDAVALDLDGVRFTSGISFTFGDVQLAPGGVVVLVSNAGAFAARYPSIPAAGQYTGNLSNGGEGLKLDDADGSTIHDFAYDDAGMGWHPTTDGAGHSLVIFNANGPLAAWGDGASWQPSIAVGGSPGEFDASILAGDVNGDLRVDLTDLAMLQSHFGLATSATRSQGDLNGDGAVDRADAAILASNFGRSLVGSP